MPVEAVHVAPMSEVTDTGAPCGAQTTRLPSAAAAIVPACAPAGAVAAGVHVTPSSVEKPTGDAPPAGNPDRTMKLGLRPAKSRLLVVEAIGLTNISCGVCRRSS